MDRHPSQRSRTPAIDSIPDRELRPEGPAQDAFLRLGITTFHDACRCVHELPYRRTSGDGDAARVLTEQCGTCSTKHGVVAVLARELGLPVQQYLGFYVLTDSVAPGIGALLKPVGLAGLPYTHCFLQYEGVRIDLTDGNDTGKALPVPPFDFVVPVPAGASRDERQRIYLEHLPWYASREPRLAALPPAAVIELVTACAAHLDARCGVVPAADVSAG
jgi:hypothetical protein